MFPTSTHRVDGRRKGFAMRAALAVLLGGGAMLAGTALPAPAIAKDKPAKAEGNSKAFADAYAPFQAITNNPAGDFAAAKAMVPTVQAAIQNATDKDTFGKALISLGSKLDDPALQQQGIQLALDSGKATPEQAGMFHFFLGKFAYDAKNYADARAHFQAAQQAGYTQNDPRTAIAETSFNGGQQAEGLKYLADVIRQEQAAGRTVPADWVRRGLAVAYQAKLAQPASEYSALLLKTDPSPKSWLEALQVVRALNQFDQAGDLDILRLMRATGALIDRSEYVAYVQAADPRRSAGEVLAVLDEGVKAGKLTTTDPIYTESKATATTRLAADRKDAPALATDAKSAASGVTAQGAGDAFYSIGDYAQAAAMYKLAIDKGVKDRDLVLTREGIAQVQAGQFADAKATLQQVGGVRAPIAKMWIAYAESKGAAA
jgi:tetratricopeptide (TPR) repeat protein